MDIFNILFLLLGLTILILGGEFLVRGASNIALRVRISPLVVGMTIVAFGTSAPELLISIKSSFEGSPDLALGNVIGSNICNLGLVLGITSLITPILVDKDSIKIYWPMTMGASIILWYLLTTGILLSWQGILLVGILIAFTIFIIIHSRRQNKALEEIMEDVPELESNSIVADLFYIIVGAMGLYFGADWFVGGAQELAMFLGVSERKIGITVLALGTSLPELVTSCVAAVKKETDLAIGNLMGSNIFNVLLILGLTSSIKPIVVGDGNLIADSYWMLGIAFLILPMMLTNKRIGRIEGFILLTIYTYYTYIVLV